MYFICKKADRWETAPEKDRRDGTAAERQHMFLFRAAMHSVRRGRGHAPPDARRTGCAPGGGCRPCGLFSGACNPVQPCYIIL